MTLPASGATEYLAVHDLTTVFHTRDARVCAVNGVCFTIKEGEFVGVVGESGSGKSVTMLSLLGLLSSSSAEIVSGSVKLRGTDLLSLPADKLRAVCGRDVGFVFQDPMTALNPLYTIGFQIMEPLREHLVLSKKNARHRALELLKLVGISSAEQRLDEYPHQCSGGMRQRVMIAMALACSPKLLIADEPTTALDVTIQAQIIELVKKLRKEQGISVIWITHDLGVIAGIADRVLVMYGGQIVEQAPVAELFANPIHPYTQALLSSLPGSQVRTNGDPLELHTSARAKMRVLKTIPGKPPILNKFPESCTFAPRCKHAEDKCRTHPPSLRPYAGQHHAACWRAGQL